MNPALEFVYRRRSVRQFLPEPLSQELIEALLSAGMAAPSACNTRAVEYLVITEAEPRIALAKLLPNGPFLKDSPCGILVCGDISRAHGGELSYLLQDCSAAIENILLAAPALGLGACWLGIHPRGERIEGARKLFELPESIIPVSAIAIGYTNDLGKPRTQYCESRIHREQW